MNVNIFKSHLHAPLLSHASNVPDPASLPVEDGVTQDKKCAGLSGIATLAPRGLALGCQRGQCRLSINWPSGWLCSLDASAFMK